MNNCPNCGAVIEPYKCKCDYCGTWYFDFTAFDMTDDKPYYVKFRIPQGVITTLAKPELQTINVERDVVNAVNMYGVPLASFDRSVSCDVNVVFHSLANPEDRSLYRLEIKSEDTNAVTRKY